MTTTRSSSSMVVKMAKREEELKEVRAKITEELQEEIVDLKEDLFMLRLQRSACHEFKSSEFKRLLECLLSNGSMRWKKKLTKGYLGSLIGNGRKALFLDHLLL